ncbi:centrosomal protein of 95 kDa isoform X2 [Trichosurus vulpecula]|uniref:centrosomal protein of 95 kDa isoform X2 n=1 Tax=Trichosurus vulpecula TaxID=9337 RepID=UPI00186B4168|nr:centrosomal protein of 95 kDa isoform X2 [Trichosurus vulpecula]
MANQRREAVLTSLHRLPKLPYGFSSPSPPPPPAPRVVLPRHTPFPQRSLQDTVPREPRRCTALADMEAREEAEWVAVVNNLLWKCHICLRIQSLSECDANVFITLYHSILGEVVPDLITAPKNQEDHAHNVQAIIDSLALDYLQVSLSHITGENIVRGNKESIKNLLEIFDGLLEYLTEYSEASSQERVETDRVAKGSIQRILSEELEEKISKTRPVQAITSFGRSSQSSDFVPSWDIDGSESTGELIRLGDTAHTFSLRKDELAASVESTEISSKSLTPNAKKLGEPIRSAIPLQPPYHPLEPPAPCPMGKEYCHSSQYPLALNDDEKHERPMFTGSFDPFSERIHGSEAYFISVGDTVTPETTSAQDQSCSMKCLNSIDKLSPTSPLSEETKLSVSESHLYSPRLQRLLKRIRSENCDLLTTDELPLHQGPSHRLTEEELHSMSEKLSHQLDELDLMLRNALSSKTKDKEEIRDDDVSFQYSDKQLKKSHPGPSKKGRQFQVGKLRRQIQNESDLRRFRAKVLADTFERELHRSEIQEGSGLLMPNEDQEVTEQEYKENIRKRPPKTCQPVKVYSKKTMPWNLKRSQWIPRGNITKAKKGVPLKIKDDNLLPMLLEEFPYLHISGQTLGKMWKQQLFQTEQLRKAASGGEQSKKKFQFKIEEALRRHDLLAEIVKKEHEHNKRLQDFKERVCKQKSTQMKIRERRQQIVRAKKYYEDYRVQLHAKMMRTRTREEVIFKNLFREGLEIQKLRLQELRNYAKERQEEQKRLHENELQSLENYYKDQFAMLAEAILQERQEIKMREKAQTKTLHKMKRELRSKMEQEIGQLQTMIIKSDDDLFFREVEAERLKARLQMASFQYSRGHFF